MPDPKQTTRLVIQLGDGGDPETFAFTCGANAWSVDLTNNFEEQTVLDCSAPLDSPAAITRQLESQDTKLSISGTVALPAFPAWKDWIDTGKSKNVKILLDESGADNGGFWVVPAVASGFSMNKSGSKTVEFNVDIAGTGRRVWTDAT